VPVNPVFRNAAAFKQGWVALPVMLAAPSPQGPCRGVKILRDATREQVENFVVYLADWAQKDRNALLCQLNSYLGKKESGAA
jgi:hypothetical protein